MHVRSIVYTSAAALGLAIVGCARNTANAPMPNDLAERTDFEKAKEPAINADTHFAAGQLAESRSDLPSAIKQYQLALKVKRDHQPALYRLAVIYTMQKDFPEAVRSWQRYVKATGGSAGACSNLALCEEYAGRPEQAEADYQRGIHADPKNEQCRVNYGLMLARHHRIAESTIQLQAVLSNAEVHYNIATVYESQGQVEQAKVEYRKAVELDPELNDAKARLATLN